jgi:hypothetical protein
MAGKGPVRLLNMERSVAGETADHDVPCILLPELPLVTSGESTLAEVYQTKRLRFPLESTLDEKQEDGGGMQNLAFLTPTE